MEQDYLGLLLDTSKLTHKLAHVHTHTHTHTHTYTHTQHTQNTHTIHTHTHTHTHTPGKFVFTSSGGVYAEDDGQMVPKSLNPKP
jgi:hypothetical protein